MLTYNTMRFGSDDFVLGAKQALYIANQPFDASSEWTHLDHFDINASLPQGSAVRFAFFSPSDSNIYRLTANVYNQIVTDAILDDDGQHYTPDTINANVILTYGNTVEELQALSGLELATGNIDRRRRMQPIIALQATGEEYPSVWLKAYFEKREIVLDKEFNRTLRFDEKRKLIDVEYNPVVTGNASALFEVAYKDTADGDYSDFMPIKEAIDKEGYAFNFRASYHVDELNATNYAKIGHVDIKTTADTACPVFGDYADIYSVTRNYFLPLKYCSVIVKHSNLEGSANIKAYVTTAPNKYLYSNYVLGSSDGSFEQVFTLPTNKYFDPSTLRVFVNAQQYVNFKFDTAENTITLREAQAGLPVSFTATYNLKDENWIELVADDTQHDISDGRFVTRFHAPISSSNAFVSAIRIRLFRGSDSTKTYTYTATGSEQSYKYSSDYDYAELTAVSGGSVDDISWEFVSSSNTITFTAPNGATVTVVATKKGVAPKVYSWTAGYFV